LAFQALFSLQAALEPTAKAHAIQDHSIQEGERFMFKQSPFVLTTAILALLGLAPLASADDNAQATQGTQAVPGASVNAAAARPPSNRDMYRALRDIETAELALVHATGDYNGHQPKALDLLKQAEAEVRAALPPPRGRRPAEGTTGN
jgi:hypothetical protein